MSAAKTAHLANREQQGGLGEFDMFETVINVKPRRSVAKGLHNFQELFQSPECLDKAM